MMRWLVRIFASAIARRVAYVLVALLLSVLGMASARAASRSDCMSSADHCDQGQAYAAAAAQLAYQQANGLTAPTLMWQCDSTSYGFQVNAQPACNGQRFFDPAATCGKRSAEERWLVDNLGAKCHNGCTYAYDPVGRAFQPTGSVCTSTDEVPEPQVDTDGDGVPDDEDAFPNDPNESQDTDGDGIGDNADTAPDDPTNGDDKKDGDEKDNKAGGGGDCNSPPSCSGDAIACNTNWQIWKLRCTSSTVTGSPENCGTAYSCTGDSAQCAQIALLRKTACSNALQGNLDTDGNGFGVGDSANLKAIKDAVTGNGTDLESPGVPWVDDVIEQKDWSSGLGGGTCPAPISRTVTIAGYSGNVDFSFQPLCDFAGLLYAVVVTLSAVTSVLIIAGVRK